MDDELANYSASSGTFEPVWTLEVQTVPEDVDRILDAILVVYPLPYGKYERNASVSGPGIETARPPAGTTTATNSADFQPGQTETYPMVELKVSVPRQQAILQWVMDAILDVHHYEESVIFVREARASRAAYNPQNDNSNRWWNTGRGLPNRIE